MGDAMPALWVPVVGYEGLYLVSHRGFARGMPRQGCDGRILKLRVSERGYLKVTLSRDCVETPFYIHRLVMEAYRRRMPRGQEVRHLDGDPGNNAWPENLIYGTHVENMADMVGHGRTIAGTRHPFTKFTDADVVAIREAWERGEKGRTLAARYGTSPAAISRLVNGVAYKDGATPRVIVTECRYPGCGAPPLGPTGRRGGTLVYCADPRHNSETAKAARRRLARAAA